MATMNQVGIFLSFSSRGVTLLLAALVLNGLFSKEVRACSWDYVIWEPRSKNADPLYRFVQSGKVGYIDQKGKVVIKPTLELFGNYHGAFHDDRLNLLPWEGPYINSTGKTVIENRFYRTYGFSEGLAIVTVRDGDKPGFIDRVGTVVIPPGIADSFSDFSEGLASFGKDGLFGYIDKSGKVVIEPMFFRTQSFSNHRARVIVEGPCKYVDEGTPCPGARVIPEGSKIENAPECKFTYIDKRGRVITTERFERAKEFSENLAAIEKDGKWGFINDKGEIQISPQFEEVGDFTGGLAPVKINSKWGFIDTAGKLVVPAKFNGALSFTDGLALVGGGWNERRSLNDEYYFIDSDGKKAIQETFELASSFFKGVAHVKLKSPYRRRSDHTDRYGTFAYIDTRGRKIFTYTRNRDDD